MKKISITVEDQGISLLDKIRDLGCFIPAYCGGRGSCGKCRVRLLDPLPEASEEDKTFFSDHDLDQGWRLACRVFGPGTYQLVLEEDREDQIHATASFGADGDQGMTATITDADGDQGLAATTSKADRGRIQSGDLELIGSIVDLERDQGSTVKVADQAEGQVEVSVFTSEPGDEPQSGKSMDSSSNSNQARALAVDIGTTTIVASILDTEKKKTINTRTGINHQRVFGADVISRIHAANRGQGRQLQQLVMGDLDRLVEDLGLGDSVEDLDIPLVIAANTSMGHLLQGLSCQGLGTYPFKPVDISFHTYKNMTILPGISTYLGADIVSGLVACGIDQKEELSILVDLGTNGEMAIGNRDWILATSTAAGPAFEGANISCGTAGVPGAIDRVSIEDGLASLTTIGGQAPVGICGSGVLEIVYELVKAGIIDRTGLLAQRYFDQGYPLAPGISFTAGDIREVQMAKAAIRAGLEILLQVYGASWDQVDRLYLAGGFGQKINPAKALGIGMLPEVLADRITAVGNSSLEGAKLLAMDPDLKARFLRVVDLAQELHLSNHPSFQDLYLTYMYFPG